MNLSKKFYRLYIDESGDHYYSESTDPERKYLCLLGCFFNLESYEKDFRVKFENFKIKHFSKDVDDRIIILHRKELINKQGHFSVLGDSVKEKSFNEELLRILNKTDFGIISVVIDKKSHHKRWGENAAHPYHYCLLAMVQRYVGFLNFNNSQGDVMAESRGGKEDLQLKTSYTQLYDTGTPFVSVEIFQKCLSSREIKLKKKEHNIAGLQVADLFAHPCKQDVLLANRQIEKYYGRFGKKLLDIARRKYNCREIFNKVDGYGRVFIK